VLALEGDLGSGKTLFTKGVACGLGVRHYQYVNSPTFVIMQEYQGRLTIHHYDTYRLEGSMDLQSLGFEEDISESRTVVVVEWADRVSELIPAEALAINFEYLEPDEPRNNEGESRTTSALLEGTSQKSRERGPGNTDQYRRLTFKGDPAIWSTTLEKLKI